MRLLCAQPSPAQLAAFGSKSRLVRHSFKGLALAEGVLQAFARYSAFAVPRLAMVAGRTHGEARPTGYSRPRAIHLYHIYRFLFHVVYMK